MRHPRCFALAVVTLCLLLVAQTCAAQDPSPATETAPDGKFQPNWESLNTRPTPKWFTDAKFGIFIHWGVYSVPAWCPKGHYAEWYWSHLEGGAFDGATRRFHEKNYGKNFEYRGFGPMFKAEMFEPDQWADVFKRSGAKYVVLTSKHHDGYCLWPAPDSPRWNSVEVGPQRDLCGDLAESVRDAGLKMGYYYSLYEWYHPLYRSDIDKYVEKHMLPQLKDLVTRYKPAVIFSDGEWDKSDTTWRSTEFLAWLYNRGPNPDEVVVNDRWGKKLRSYCGDYYTTEYGHGGDKAVGDHAWEENRGIGMSFGYNRNEDIDDYATRTECVRMLIDMASRGGNLLLDVGPTADGRIPVVMQDRLLAIGRWLEANGESIFETTAGPFRSSPWGRATTRGNTLYLHVYDWPTDGTLRVPGLRTDVKSARLLADPRNRKLPVQRSDAFWTAIDLSGHYPREHATVVAVELAGTPEVDGLIYPTRDGSIVLAAATAGLHGKNIQFQHDRTGGNIGFWNNVEDWLSWDFVVDKPGVYDIVLRYSCEEGSEGSTYVVTVGGREVDTPKVEHTETWQKWRDLELPAVTIDKTGKTTLAIKPTAKPGEAVLNFKSIRLVPGTP